MASHRAARSLPREEWRASPPRVAVTASSPPGERIAAGPPLPHPSRVEKCRCIVNAQVNAAAVPEVWVISAGRPAAPTRRARAALVLVDVVPSGCQGEFAVRLPRASEGEEIASTAPSFFGGGPRRMLARSAHEGEESGRHTTIVVPLPGLLSASMVPPWFLTIPRLTDKPSPVPRPSGFVV